MYNQYQPSFYSSMQTMPPQQIIRVTGENGARAYQLPPSSSILLLDSTEPIVWLKTTDGAGYPTVIPYHIEEIKPQQKVDVNDFDERLRKLEEMIYGKSNNSEVESATADIE